jgi:hypothetical protein
MGEIKPISTPETTFKVDGANYRFLIPQFYHGTVITAEEALDNPALLKELVDIHRKAEDKPEVGDGLLQLVEVEDEDAGSTTKLAPWQTVVKSIQDAATVDEVNALTVGDNRKSVTDAATARIAIINKAGK